MTRGFSLIDVVRSYDSEGWHRTGSKVAIRSISHLRDLLVEAGCQAQLEPFTFTRFIPARSGLRVGDRWISGVPAFDGNLTPPGGLVARLGYEATPGVVPIVSVSPFPQRHQVDELRHTDGVPAIVAITTGGARGLALRNAPNSDRPFGPPVLQVSSNRRASLEAIAASGHPVLLTATGRRLPGRGYNLVVEVDGPAEPPPLVVMTPHTGWWFCTGERGGGIASWLAALLRIHRSNVERRVVFLVTQGHELAHPGLRSFLSAHPDLDDEAATWFHLGANIAAHGSSPTLHSDDPNAARLLAECLVRAGEGEPRRSETPLGDARHLKHAATLSLTGGASPQFHLPADRLRNVDAARLLRMARAVADTVSALAGPV